MSEFDGTLDLTGSNPDEVGYPAIPSGSYQAHVAKAEWRTTENISGSKALPHNTPYLALGIQVNEDEEPRESGESTQRVANAYVWTNLFIPPADYDATKAQTMKNRLANFLAAIDEPWDKKGYKMPDVDGLLGRAVTVVVRRKYDKNQEKFVNEVEGFKPEGAGVESSLLA